MNTETILDEITGITIPRQYDISGKDLQHIVERTSHPLSACYLAFKLGYVQGKKSSLAAQRRNRAEAAHWHSDIVDASVAFQNSMYHMIAVCKKEGASRKPSTHFPTLRFDSSYEDIAQAVEAVLLARGIGDSIRPLAAKLYYAAAKAYIEGVQGVEAA